MTKTPDPSYWGNPPQTPTARSKRSPLDQGPQDPAQNYSTQAAHDFGQAQNSQETQSYTAAQTTPQPEQAVTGAQSSATTPTQSTHQASHDPGVASNNEADPKYDIGQGDGQTPPPQTGQPYHQTPEQPKKKKKWLIPVIIVALIVVVLGIAGCVAAFNIATTAFDSSTSSVSEQLSDEDTPQSDADDTSSETSDYLTTNNEYVRYFFGINSSSTEGASITTDELNTIQKTYFEGESKLPDEEGYYEEGVYFIGTDIPEESYWFDGEDDEPSYFFILQPSETSEDAYDVVHVNMYYGHNYMNLYDGEVLILANDDEMIDVASCTETYNPPYENGMYLVGYDIPAGTYQLSLGEANDYSAYYVMQDLEYNSDSTLYSAKYISGDQPETITLVEGTYIELYNMNMTPVSSDSGSNSYHHNQYRTTHVGHSKDYDVMQKIMNVSYSR